MSEVKNSFYAPDDKNVWYKLPNNRAQEMMALLSEEVLNKDFKQFRSFEGPHFYQVKQYAGMAWITFWPLVS